MHIMMGNAVFQKIPTITQDLSRRCIATRGESVSTYPRRPKVEAFSHAVDVVELLRDPTDPSTERTAPPRSAHVQLDDVPRALDSVEDEGEFHQHDDVMTVMMLLRRGASPKHRYDMTEVEYGGGGHRTRLGEINKSTCLSMGCPLPQYIKEERRGGAGPLSMARPRGVLLPPRVGFPFPSRTRNPSM